MVVVVFDNGAFGNVKRIQQERYGNRLIASDLQNPDFAKLAESFASPRFKGARRQAAGGRSAQGVRAECARARLGTARRRAEPLGPDHDAQGPRLIDGVGGLVERVSDHVAGHGHHLGRRAGHPDRESDRTAARQSRPPSP